MEQDLFANNIDIGRTGMLIMHLEKVHEGQKDLGFRFDKWHDRDEESACVAGHAADLFWPGKVKGFLKKAHSNANEKSNEEGQNGYDGYEIPELELSDNVRVNIVFMFSEMMGINFVDVVGILNPGDAADQTIDNLGGMTRQWKEGYEWLTDEELDDIMTLGNKVEELILQCSAKNISEMLEDYMEDEEVNWWYAAECHNYDYLKKLLESTKSTKQRIESMLEIQNTNMRKRIDEIEEIRSAKMENMEDEEDDDEYDEHESMSDDEVYALAAMAASLQK